MVDTSYLVHRGSGPNRDPNCPYFEQLMLRTEKRLRQLIRNTLGKFQLVNRLEGSGVVLVGLQMRLYRRLSKYSLESSAEFFQLAARELHRELLDIVKTYRQHLGNPKLPIQLPVDEEGSELSIEFLDPSQSAEDLRKWECFYQKIDSLEGDFGEIFRMRYLADSTYEEIGKRFRPNDSVANQRKWAERAFRKACKMLIDSLGEDLPEYFLEDL